MKAVALSVLAACGIAACAAPGPGPATSALRLVALPNADLEAEFPPGSRCPARWNCSSHADPDSYRFFIDETAPASGKQSLCIERVTNEPWAIATVTSSDPALRGARVRFSLSVRLEGATGPGAGPWVLVHGPSGNLHHDQKLAQGRRGWERMAVEFTVPPNVRILEVGATLEGPGRVCVDDARLEILEPAKTAV
jgi:hypothetical protein